MESGTHGRRWYTDEKNNIAFSLLWKANCEISKLEGITLEIAETLVEVLRKLYNITLLIKFPNDLVWQGKKIGGILTETKVKGNIVKYVVMGIRYKYATRKIQEEKENLCENRFFISRSRLSKHRNGSRFI